MKNGYVMFLLIAIIVCCFAAVIHSTDIELFTTQTNDDQLDDDAAGGEDTSDDKGRTFLVVIENFCEKNVVCYLTVDNLRYGDSFTISSNKTIAVDIIEDDLFIKKDSYDISLFAEIDYLEKGTAFNVTESAEFLIHKENGALLVESIDAQ